MNIYFRKHHPGKGTKFVADVNRVFNFAKGIIGDPALSKIKRLDASKVLDAMLARDWKTASVRRNMAVLSAIFNIGILEYEIDAKNPFAAHKIPNLFEDARKVLSFSETELRQIADAALSQKKPEGLICAMLINLGCRVSEVAMLRRGDLHPDAEIPYVDIREHKEHQRTLKKGKASERILPLLGVSLQAARLARASAKDGGWLFDIGHRNPSAQVNRWLVRNFGEEAGRSHSFRHSLETRLVWQRLISASLTPLSGIRRKRKWAASTSADIRLQILPKPWRGSLSVEGLRPAKMTSLPFWRGSQEGRKPYRSL